MSRNGEQLLNGHTGRMLGLLSIGLAFVRLGRRLLPPLLPTVVADLSITSFQAGLVLSIAAGGFALLQFPSGRLSDRLTRKTAILASLSILVVGSVILSGATTFIILLAGAAVVGMGEGLYGAADRGLLSDLFVEKRGAAFGIHTTFSDLGGILAAGLAAGALAFGVWQVAFLPTVAGLVVVATLLHRWGVEPVVIEPVSLHTRETVGRLFGQRRIQWLLLAYSLFAVTAQGFVGFLPALLQAEHGFSPGFASAAFAGMFATGIVARPVAGRLSDRRNRLAVAGTGLVLGALGVATLATAGSSIVAIAGVIVFAMGQKAFPAPVQAYLMDTFPEGGMAGDLGAVRTIYVGAGSLGPVYVGYVAGRLSYTTAFAGFVIMLLGAGFITLGIARDGP